MQIHYTLIIIATIVQFVLGALWYSPLMFGKWWMVIMGADQYTKEELQKMQKTMAPFYGLQLLLTIVFTFVLSMFITTMSQYSPYLTAFFVLIGFVVPTQISGVIWGSTKKQFWGKQIFIMVLYQLVAIMLAALILSM